MKKFIFNHVAEEYYFQQPEQRHPTKRGGEGVG